MIERDAIVHESDALSRRGVVKLAAAGLLAAGGTGLALSRALGREAEPGDDRGGHGNDDPPGDDRSGRRGGDGRDDDHGRRRRRRRRHH